MKLLKYFTVLSMFLVFLGTSVSYGETPKTKPVTKTATKKTVEPVKVEKPKTVKVAPTGKIPNASITVGSAKKRDVVPTPGKVKEPQISTNELKLRQLAELVEDLKNKVTATKYRLQLLKEAMTSETETLGGAKIKIVHENKMGGKYKLVRIRYFLDGKLIQSLSAANSKDKSLLSKKSINVFSDHVSIGNKRLRVFITYQGNGYGVFSYVKKWKWEVHNSFSFTVEAGKYYTLKVIGKEKGGFTTPLAKRPKIKFKLVSKPLVAKSKAKNKKSK